MGDVMDFLGDSGGLDEEIVGRILETLARPRHVDDRINDQIGHVNTLRAEVACDRLGEDALSCLGRRKASEIRLSPQCGRIARDDESPSPAAIIRGATCLARCSKAITFVSKLARRISGATS